MNNMEEIKEFTHGIMAINPNQPDENDDLEILHFVGYWSEPTEDDVISLWEELKTNGDFGLKDYMDEVELRPAPTEIVEYYNKVVNWDEVGDETNFD
jgi:hypothetical protein